VDLVDQQQLAGRADAELVLRVGQDQPGASGQFLSAGEQFQRGVLDLAPQRRRHKAFARHVGRAQRFVVAAVLGFGGRCDDGRRQVRVLAQAVGEVVPVDRPRPVVVLAPQ